MSRSSKNKLICIVGMCGSGKSEVSDYMAKVRPFGFVRFGQVTMDKIKEMGKKPSEKLEREIRENLRKEFGMGAFATLNIPKFDALLEEGDVIGDGLYSWEEYLELRKRYGKQLVVVAVYAPPDARYHRLETRSKRHRNDREMRYRSFTKEEAAARDKAEIENLNKGGPIAMADFTIDNSSLFSDMFTQVDQILDIIFKKRK